MITDTLAFQILNEAMKGMKHVVIYLTTYSFHGIKNWQILVIDNNLIQVNVKYTIIKFNLYFMVYSIVLKFEKIWLSGTLNIIRKPKKSLFSKRKKGHNSGTVNVKYTVIELNLYLMVHSIVLKFEKIWLSHTLNIIRKPKKSLFSKRNRATTQER